MALTLKTEHPINNRNKVYFVPVTTLHRRQVNSAGKAVQRNRKFYWPICQSEAARVVGHLDRREIRFSRERTGRNHWILDQVDATYDSRSIEGWTIEPIMQKFLHGTGKDFGHWKEIRVTLGTGVAIDLTSVDHLDRETLQIYLGATGSSARIRTSSDMLHVVSKDVKSKRFYAPSGGGLLVTDPESNQVVAEVFPNHIFILVKLSYDQQDVAHQRKALMWICDQAAKLQHKHFSDPESIRKWRRKGLIPIHNLDPNTLGKLLTDVVEEKRFRASKELEKVQAEERALSEEWEALLRRQRDLELEMSGLTATQQAAYNEVKDNILGSLSRIRGYESIVFDNGWLSGTTEVVYSKLRTDPIRLFRIGQVRVDVNVITGKIKFTNLTYPEHSLAAPHIRQNQTGCLDPKIRRDITKLHRKNKFDGIFITAMRLLAASGHESESKNFPEVDPTTYKVIHIGDIETTRRNQ